MQYLKKSNSHNQTLQMICFCLIWAITLYSSVIQQKYFEIPNGMLIMGVALIACFLLYISGTPLLLNEILPGEEMYQFLFLIYLAFMGLPFAVSVDSHYAQLLNTFEYFLIMVLTAYLIRRSGSDSIHVLLLITAAWLALIMIFDPVPLGNGRYSVSLGSNPNGIGMSITSGIWAVLYLQRKKGLPLFLTFAIVGFLGYAMLLTGSRKSLIAAGITLFLWFIFVFLPGLKYEGLLKGVFTVLVICIIGVILGSFFLKEYSGSTIATRMGKLENEATGGKRYQFYLDGLKLFREHPVFGIGFQGFKYYYLKYSHSTIVEVPVSGGLIGSVLYFASYIVSLRKMIRLARIARRDERCFDLNMDIRMLLILWAAILFYCICIIHPYQFDSFIFFAITFGQTGAIERSLNERIMNGNVQA